MVDFEEITEGTPTESNETPGNADAVDDEACNTERLAAIEAKREPSASGAARLRALRKKRFKQKQEAVAVDNDKEVKDVSAATSLEERIPEKPAKVEPVEEQTRTASPTQPSSETKKYQGKLIAFGGSFFKMYICMKFQRIHFDIIGVAAIRRKKVMEKRQKEQKEAEKSEKKAQEMIENMTSPKINTAPYYELLVLAILFVCGFFIGGLQRDSFIVKSGFHYLSPSSHSEDVGSIPNFQQTQDILDEVDEFGSFGVKEGTEEEIDPFFRVDLDKYTQGDSIFMSAARFAVGIHRSIIYFPAKVMRNPPILLLVAVLIRKIIRVPKFTESKPASDNMVANAMNFISSFFPGLVSIYDTYKRARLDLYIVFTGFLLGAILSTKGDIYASNDEL